MEARGRPGYRVGGAAAEGEREGEREGDESETESEDSDCSYDSIEEEEFMEGRDPLLDRDYTDEDTSEEWEPSPEQRGTLPGSSPSTKKRRTSSSPLSEGSISTPSSAPTKTPRLPRSGPTTVGHTVQSGGDDDEGDTWHDISEADKQPDLPKFYPKRRPGSQLAPNAAYSPLELFQIFLSESVVGSVVTNTNAFARKRAQAGKRLAWFPLTVQELYTYMGIVIFMGLMPLKTLDDYWSEEAIYGLRFPGSVMSRKRFLAITWNLHLCDLEKDEENKRQKGTPGFDRLFKIKPLYTSLLLACQACYQPKRELFIDERTVSLSARIGLTQYMKDKPTQRGYKLFVLVDSATGYTWNFVVYDGKTVRKTGKGVGYDLVTELVSHPLLSTGYKLYLDRFYTSPALLSDLYAADMLACGTIPTNRQGFPRGKSNDMPRNAARGTIRWTRRGELLFVKWMDTREVAICTTFHKAYNGDKVNKRVRDNQGACQDRQVPIPCAVKDYNKVTGRVVHSDALLGYYNVLRQTKRWYTTFFCHFMDIAVENSFILHRELAKENGKDTMTNKQFREALVSELTKVCARSAPPPQRSAENECYPGFFTEDPSVGRRVCVLCRLDGKTMKTPAYCVKCQVPLCLMPKRNCFLQWHQEGFQYGL